MFRVYTHNDLDGVGCGIVAKCSFGDKVEVRYNSIEGLNFQVERFLERTKDPARRDRDDGCLFITDLSVNEPNERGLDEYASAGGKVKLIDHHKTALHLNRYPWGMVNVEYEDGRLASATSLFYDYLLQHGFAVRSAALDDFVELVRQYDTWEWDRNDNVRAKRLNDLFFMLSIDDFEEKMVERLKSGGDKFEFDEFEEKILNMEEEKIERYVRRKRREVVQTFIHDRCVGIVHAESYHSELGNELGKDNPHLDYIAILNVGSKRASLRTIHEDVDVSQIAGRYGGGGHAKASGCSLTEEMYRLYVAEPFRMEPMKPDAFRNSFNVKGSEDGCLFENRKETKFFVYLRHGKWWIDMDEERIDESFAAFEDAEKYVKRQHAAALARDEAYVRYLSDQLVRSKDKPD